MKPAVRDRHGNILDFGTRRFGFFKGQWYWERDLGPLVVMWQHNGAHKGRSKGLIRCGPLYIWWNTASRFALALKKLRGH